MKNFIGKLLIVFGSALGLYVGGWLLLLAPLLNLMDIMALNTLTISVLLTEIIKILLAIPTGAIITYIFLLIGASLCIKD